MKEESREVLKTVWKWHNMASFAYKYRLKTWIPFSKFSFDKDAYPKRIPSIGSEKLNLSGV